MLNKRLIKQIVVESYTDDTLDEGKVNKIVSHLNHDDLKIYIKALKYMEKKLTVTIDAPLAIDKDSKKELQDMFLAKRMVYNVDPSLLLGLKITDNDDVYDLSLKKKFEIIENFLEETYD